MNALVCAVERDNEIHIPKGDFTLHLGDKVTIAADAADLVKLIKNLGVYSPKAPARNDSRQQPARRRTLRSGLYATR